VQRVWRTFGLKSHQTESFKLSSDPLFTEKVRGIVGLYLSPPDRALVLCVDEKTEMQAIARAQPVLPMSQRSRGGAARTMSGMAPHPSSQLWMWRWAR
jgi:hypothetical protein